MVGFIMLKGLLDVALDVFVGIISTFQELFTPPQLTYWMIDATLGGGGSSLPRKYHNLFF
jgi:hypothetical protein